MIKAENIMTSDVITFTPGTEILEAARILLEKEINGAPVVDEKGRVVGILCRSDLVAQQKQIPLPGLFSTLGGYIPLTSTKQLDKEVRKIAALTVGDAMTPKPATVQPGTELMAIAGLMVDKGFHTLPVIDQGGRLVGVIGKKDVLKTLLQTPPA
jgi:CBS-domain-containing membrane protein